ncbi:MAG: prolyl oligopeptidase family serine peptidase, partial [Blastocatellia bacterium]
MNRTLIRSAACFCVLALITSGLFSLSTFAQDASQVLQLSVGFRTLKNRAPMSDEKRKEVEALEAKTFAANANKNYGEAVKHMQHGFAVMRNQPWTPVVALSTATQAKLKEAIFDPGDTLKLTLTQIFTLDEPVTGKLNGALSIASTKDGKQETLKELKVLKDVEPDFTKSLTLEAAIPDLPDGNYQIVVKLSSKNEEMLYKSNSIRIARDVNTQAGLLKMRAVMFRTDLEKGNKTALLAALPAAEYSASMIDLINAGQLPVERTDLKAAIANANSLLDQIAKGENPLRAKRGDIHWAYRSAVDETLQPYRIFVPANYATSNDAAKKWPLVVALHGMGGDENSFFAGYNNGEIKRIAEARGYIIACPKGRGPAAMYMGTAERDVLDVIKEVKREYAIDDSRVYLMGHSMGGYGSWSVAVNNPDLFAAIAPISGGGQPLVIGKLKGITNVPWIVVHGDKDPTVSVEESRKMVKAGKDLGIEIKYIEVPGGDHSSIAVPAFKDIFDWFDAHKRQPAGAKAAA